MSDEICSLCGGSSEVEIVPAHDDSGHGRARLYGCPVCMEKEMSKSSTWVVLCHRCDVCTTVDFPGIGKMVAFGEDKRKVGFLTFDKAMAAGEAASDEYGGVYEIARLDLVLGVCE